MFADEERATMAANVRSVDGCYKRRRGGYMIALILRQAVLACALTAGVSAVVASLAAVKHWTRRRTMDISRRG